MLCQAVLDETSSDLFVHETIQAQGIATRMPDDCVTVTAVKLDVGFQGNRYVKKSYDTHSKMCYIRALPAIITYKRHLRLSDLEDGTVKGARLKYLKTAIMEKMASKEISYLTTVNLESDAGSINLSAVEKFRDDCHNLVAEMQQDVTLYSNG
jgi:hypothetical protein